MENLPFELFYHILNYCKIDVVEQLLWVNGIYRSVTSKWILTVKHWHPGHAVENGCVTVLSIIGMHKKDSRCQAMFMRALWNDSPDVLRYILYSKRVKPYTWCYREIRNRDVLSVLLEFYTPKGSNWTMWLEERKFFNILNSVIWKKG